MADKTKDKKKIVETPDAGELLQSASAYLVKRAKEMGSEEMIIKHLGMKIQGQPVGDWEVIIRRNGVKISPSLADAASKVERKEPGIKSPEFYTLLVDRDRDRVLGYMVEIALKEPTNKLVKFLRNRGLEEVSLTLLKEMSDKNHDLDWCEDPNCSKRK